MALPSITASNFTGWLKIVANEFKEADITEYITLFREQYLREIVGDAAFIAIRDEAYQKWIDLINGVDFVNTDGKNQRHNGLLDGLLRFIYFEYVRDNFTSSQTGKVKGKSENSERATDLEILNVSKSRYNQGVRMINGSTSCFLEAYELLSEEITLSVDNADNTYTLSIPDTTYLEAGNKLTIDGVDYTAVSVTANTSVVIDAGQIGLDFTGDSISWKPFKDVVFCDLKICGI